MRGKQRGEGRMKDDRKVGRRRQNGRFRGKQGGEGKIEDERKAERRRQNGR
jgi:hypothetical protein